MVLSETVADVIVIGGGGAGLAAAIEAASLGRKVILLEKNPAVGGSTNMAIGTYTATATPHQMRKGIEDSPDEHFEDLGKFNEKVKGVGVEDNLALRRLLVDNANDTLRWLMSLGIVFFGPTPEPPHRKPRMHNVLPNSRSFGYHLAHKARALGVDIRVSRRVKEILLAEGRVSGVECLAPEGKLERYLARDGVVLSSGDFSASQDMKRQFGSLEAARIGPTNPANTGDGHAMAMAIGARVINGHFLLASVRFAAPPVKWIHMLPPWRPLAKFMEWSLDRMPGWLLRPFIMSFLTTILAVSTDLFKAGAIMVNTRGERFADELNQPVYRLAEQPDQTAYIIVDAALAKKFSAFPYFVSTAPGIAYAYLPDYERSRPDVVSKADTLAALAQKIGADPVVLEQTVAAHNTALAAGKNEKGFPQLLAGPFFALGPMRSYINFTEGGLAVNEQLEVLGANDKPVPGLYAAGSVGQGGMVLEGHGHHLAWAFISGRMAGRNVVSAAGRALTQ